MAEYEENLIQFDVPPPFRDIKLPSFWSDKPSSWFALAESCFRTRTHGITGEQAKFDQLVGALNKESIGRVLDLIEVPPLFSPYAQLKARLLDAHQVDQLLKMGDLGARRPSELLAAILELCPHGQETSLFFTHLFLCRLPSELRIMLGEDNHQDVRLLITKADKLWALHGQKSSLIATVDQPEEEPSVVAAISSRGRGGRGSRGNIGQQPTARGHQHQPGSQPGGQQSRQVSQQPSGGQTAATSVSPSDLARMGSDLCFFHWSWGDKARNCVAPCSWQGN